MVVKKLTTPALRSRLVIVGGLLLVFFLVAPLCIPRTAIAQYGYHFGRNKIQYENFEWQVLHTEHFDIYHYPEMQELAENGAQFAEEAYTELQNKFSFALNNRVPIIFYSSNLHFKQTNITPGFIPDGVGGFFEFLKGRVVIPANGNLHRFRRVIRHELVHVFTYNKLLRVMRDYRKVPDTFLPLWFTEGLAEYWSGDPDYNHEMVMRDAVYSNYLVPLDNIHRITGTFQMYKQGEAIFKFVGEEYGEEAILDMIDNFWRHRDFKKVIEMTLGEDFDIISQKWSAWMKAKYYEEWQEIDAPSLIASTVAGRGFNSKPAFYTFPNGTKKVYFVSNRSGYSSIYQVEVNNDFVPTGKPRPLVKGERSNRFEAFHLFESKISISKNGRLAFVTKSGGRDVIHVYDLLADRHTNTFGFEQLNAVYSPDWNSTGNKLAFTAIGNSGFADIYTYDLETKALQRVTDDHYDDRDPAFSPDDASIAFSSDRTNLGKNGAYNIFKYDTDSGALSYITYGDRIDQAPRWNSTGKQLVFTSTVRDESGRYDAQNLWVANFGPVDNASGSIASTVLDASVDSYPVRTQLTKLTNVSSAIFDPEWVDNDRLIFSSFEAFRFGIRSLQNVDSLLANPLFRSTVVVDPDTEKWAFESLGQSEGIDGLPYKKRYKLDLAQGQVSQSAVLGTVGGAVLAFSDMLGDDYLYLTLINSANTQRDFLKSLSFSVSRYHLDRRANYGYGLYRFSGQRFDITDPDASANLPVFYETVYGGFGSVSYPLSKFRRLEVSSSLNWSDKEVNATSRQALLLSNSVSLIHDTALYSWNGPVSGWRAGLTSAYTTDIKNSNVSYFTLHGDVRKYFRLGPGVTFASRVMGHWNEGREARLWVLGGSWDLRGYRLFRVRGEKMWFTSHELRFPIVNAPYLLTPILAPFGVVNLRGALFFDAAHAWNNSYSEAIPEIYAGDTLGATGVGLRLNLFGGFVLRYDLGYRYRDGFKDRDKFFRQFFFGWDF